MPIADECVIAKGCALLTQSSPPPMGPSAHGTAGEPALSARHGGLGAPGAQTVTTASYDHTDRLWDVIDLGREALVGRTGDFTNHRVCRDSLEVVVVLPFPEADSVWAPEGLCAQGNDP